MGDMTTSWLWKAGDGVNGLKINTERGILEWYDSLGCACGDTSTTQTYREFLTRGAAFSDVPDDVEAEVQAALSTLGTSKQN